MYAFIMLLNFSRDKGESEQKDYESNHRKANHV
jgi:hypothetical protein